jgi:hypothetical protein
MANIKRVSYVVEQPIQASEDNYQHLHTYSTAVNSSSVGVTSNKKKIAVLMQHVVSCLIITTAVRICYTILNIVYLLIYRV